MPGTSQHDAVHSASVADVGQRIGIQQNQVGGATDLNATCVRTEEFRDRRCSRRDCLERRQSRNSSVITPMQSVTVSLLEVVKTLAVMISETVVLSDDLPLMMTLRA